MEVEPERIFVPSLVPYDLDIRSDPDLSVFNEPLSLIDPTGYDACMTSQQSWEGAAK